MPLEEARTAEAHLARERIAGRGRCPAGSGAICRRAAGEVGGGGEDTRDLCGVEGENILQGSRFWQRRLESAAAKCHRSQPHRETITNKKQPQGSAAAPGQRWNLGAVTRRSGRKQWPPSAAAKGRCRWLPRVSSAALLPATLAQRRVTAWLRPRQAGGEEPVP